MRLPTLGHVPMLTPFSGLACSGLVARRQMSGSWHSGNTYLSASSRHFYWTPQQIGDNLMCLTHGLLSGYKHTQTTSNKCRTSSRQHQNTTQHISKQDLNNFKTLSDEYPNNIYTASKQRPSNTRTTFKQFPTSTVHNH